MIFCCRRDADRVILPPSGISVFDFADEVGFFAFPAAGARVFPFAETFEATDEDRSYSAELVEACGAVLVS